MSSTQLERILKSIEERMDGVIGPIIQLEGYLHPINLEDLTCEEAGVVLDYFGSIH
jgi:hypothetical protein